VPAHEGDAGRLHELEERDVVEVPTRVQVGEAGRDLRR
jgi:hypothetical protein